MKTLVAWLSLSIVLGACADMFLGDRLESTPEATFDEFWKGISNTWPEFQTRRLNWDSVYTLYRPLVNASSTEFQLATAMSRVCYSLKDTHTSVNLSNGAILIYLPPFPHNFYGLDWVKTRYPVTFKTDGNITYGVIRPGIGYIYVKSFANDIDSFSKMMATIMEQFSSLKGIIIDVRDNGGGGDDKGRVIAEWFIDETRVYAYRKWRTGPDRNQMSEFITDATKRVREPYGGKVAVLTNRNSYSATENFVMMMDALPNVILVGDLTGGGSSTKPILKELPNGWTYRVSSMLLCDTNYQPITGGIVPDIRIFTKKADSLAHRDSIIEAALIELTK
jgi:hypothetical protein